MLKSIFLLFLSLQHFSHMALVIQGFHQLKQRNDEVVDYRRMKNDTMEHLLVSIKTEDNTRAKPFLQSIAGSPCTVHSTVVDCSNQSLQTINPSWFPRNSQIILLNNNHLTNVVDSSFAHVDNLTFLDLSNNEIADIEPRAFDGLQYLEKLNLNYNNLCFSTNHISEKTFSALGNLRELNVIQISYVRDCNASHAFLKPLRKLVRLSIGANEEILYFGSEFRSLTSLEVLEIAGSTEVISDNTFENLGGLKELLWKETLSISKVSSSAFVPLINLTVLKMENVLVDVQYVLSLLAPFVGKNMTEISLNMVTTTRERATPIKNGYLTANDTKHLLKICLRSFSLINSYISYISINAFSYSNVWQDCLVNLVVSDNPLQGSGSALFPMTRYRHLETITIDKALKACNRFPDFQYTNEEKSTEMLSENRIGGIMEDNFDDNASVHSNLDSNLSGQIFLTVKIPISLKTLKVSRLITSTDMDVNIQFVDSENVEYLDMSDNGFKRFVGNIQGLNFLKNAIVSGNDMSELIKSFFDGFLELENLFLSKCSLQRDFVALHSRRIFKIFQSFRD